MPVFSKILERVLYDQLATYFNKNGLISGAQHGFRPQRGTSTAVTDLLMKIYDAYEKGEYLAVSFLDLSKAFDCVDTEILLRKLYFYNLHPSAIRMLHSYLTTRMQAVVSKNERSDFIETTQGVPQGSILGPLLFIIYTNDLPRCTENVLMYADDTALYQNHHLLNVATTLCDESRRKVGDWFLANKLKENVDKAVGITFTTKQITPTHCKYLGLYIDSRLTWSEHGDQTAKKLNSTIYVLRNLACKVSLHTLKCAYHGLLESRLRYGILAWGSSAIRHRMFAIQRRAVRVIAGTPYREDCRKDFRSLEIMTLPCIFIYSCLNHIVENSKRYKGHHDNHGYETRQRFNFQPPQLRLAKTQNYFENQSIKFYNVLPECMRKLNVDAFRSKFKQILLANAFYSTDEFIEYFV